MKTKKIECVKNYSLDFIVTLLTEKSDLQKESMRVSSETYKNIGRIVRQSAIPNMSVWNEAQKMSYLILLSQHDNQKLFCMEYQDIFNFLKNVHFGTNERNCYFAFTKIDKRSVNPDTMLDLIEFSLEEKEKKQLLNKKFSKLNVKRMKFLIDRPDLIKHFKKFSISEKVMDLSSSQGFLLLFKDKTFSKKIEKPQFKKVILAIEDALKDVDIFSKIFNKNSFYFSNYKNYNSYINNYKFNLLSDSERHALIDKYLSEEEYLDVFCHLVSEKQWNTCLKENKTVIKRNSKNNKNGSIILNKDLRSEMSMEDWLNYLNVLESKKIDFISLSSVNYGRIKTKRDLIIKLSGNESPDYNLFINELKKNYTSQFYNKDFYFKDIKEHLPKELGNYLEKTFKDKYLKNEEEYLIDFIPVFVDCLSYAEEDLTISRNSKEMIELMYSN